MKKLLYILAFVPVAVTNTHAQTFALAAKSQTPEFTSYTAINFAGYRGEHRRLGPLTLTGGIAAAAGFVVTVAGAVIYIVESLDGYNDPNPNYQPPANQYATGTAMLEVGGCLALAGTVAGITGLIHDRNQRERWGVITPKPNQVGLAYNF